MVTFNLLNIVLYLIVAFAIWGVLPQDYKEEIGGLVGVGLEIIWFFIWFGVFVLGGHQIIIK